MGEEEFEEEGEEAFWQALKEFLEDHKEDIGEVIKAYASNMKASLRQKGWTTAGVFILLGGVVGVIAFLALRGIVSGETIAFLVGAHRGLSIQLHEAVHPRGRNVTVFGT